MPRPSVTLKLATSLDGKIALANGQSEWITGEAAREAGRRLRGSHDGIAVGANTAVLDNPQLTTRIDGLPNPVRIVFDSQLRLSVDSNLVQTAQETPTWVFTKSLEVSYANTLKNNGVVVLPVAYDKGLDVPAALDILHRRSITTLLVEGGGQLAASFLKTGCVDRIEWFRAPLILGGDGRDCIGALGLENLMSARQYERVEWRELGPDMYERYEKLS